MNIPWWRKPALWAATLVCGMTLLFLCAGTWQMQRAHYKERLQAKVAATAAAAVLPFDAQPVSGEQANLRRVSTRGLWVAEKSILLDNKVRDGVVGYEVVTPLKLQGGDRYVLVNRGWIKAPRLRSELPLVNTPSGPLSVEGTARVISGRFIELGNDAITGSVWQNLTVERYQAWSGYTLQPFVVYQSAGDDDGLARVLPAPEAAGINADRHRGYAMTWYGLALVTAVLGVLAWRKSRESRKA